MKNIIKATVASTLLVTALVASVSAADKYQGAFTWSNKVEVIRADLGGVVVLPKAPTVSGTYTKYSETRPDVNPVCYDGEFNVAKETSINGSYYVDATKYVVDNTWFKNGNDDKTVPTVATAQWYWGYSSANIRVIAPAQAAKTGYVLSGDKMHMEFATAKEMMDYLVTKGLAFVVKNDAGIVVGYKTLAAVNGLREWYYVVDGVQYSVKSNAGNLRTATGVTSVYYYTTTGNAVKQADGTTLADDAYIATLSTDIKAIIAKTSTFKKISDPQAAGTVNVTLSADGKAFATGQADASIGTIEGTKYSALQVSLPAGINGYYGLVKDTMSGVNGQPWLPEYGVLGTQSYEKSLVSSYTVGAVTGGETCDATTGLCTDVPAAAGYTVSIHKYANPTNTSGRYVGLVASWTIGTKSYEVPVFAAKADLISFANGIIVDTVPVTDTTALVKCLYKGATSAATGLTVSASAVDASTAGVKDLVWSAKDSTGTVVASTTTKVAVMPKYARKYAGGKVVELTSYHLTGEVYAVYSYDYAGGKVTAKFYDVAGVLVDTTVENI